MGSSSLNDAGRAALAVQAQALTGVDEFGRLLLITEALSIRETCRKTSPGDPISAANNNALQERSLEIEWLLSLYEKAKSIETASQPYQWAMEAWPDIVVTCGARLSSDEYTLNGFRFGEKKITAVWPDMASALQWKAACRERATSCNLVEIQLGVLLALILKAQLFDFILYDLGPSDGEWDLAEAGSGPLPQERLIAVDEESFWGFIKKLICGASFHENLLDLIKMKAARRGLSAVDDILPFVVDELNCVTSHIQALQEEPQKPCAKCFSKAWVFHPAFREVGIAPARWRCLICGFPWVEMRNTLSSPDARNTAISLLGPERVQFVEESARVKAVAEENPWLGKARYYLGKDCPAEVQVAALPALEHALEHCPPPETCSRCGETCFRFVSLSPNLKAANWKCGYCSRMELVREGHSPNDSELGREPIPKNVQREVWQRDGGRCVECGNKENLEFDHIIPVSRGGASTARNVQLLCQNCNRRKAANNPGEY